MTIDRFLAGDQPLRNASLQLRLGSTASSACEISADKVVTASSIPTDMRTRPSSYPQARPSDPAARRWCVVVAGWVRIDLASPRLLEITAIRERVEEAERRHLTRLSDPATTRFRLCRIHLCLHQCVLGVTRHGPG